MIEQLHDNGDFGRYRVSLEDFYPSYQKEDGTQIPINPSQGLHIHRGFFVTSSFKDQVLPVLKPRAPELVEKYLFVWVAQKEIPWKEVFKDFNGRKNPMRWWLIQPLLAWQESGNISSLVPKNEHGAQFFLHEEDGSLWQSGAQKLVSLQYNRESCHREWHLDCPEQQIPECCYRNQVMLSVV